MIVSFVFVLGRDAQTSCLSEDAAESIFSFECDRWILDGYKLASVCSRKPVAQFVSVKFVYEFCPQDIR